MRYGSFGTKSRSRVCEFGRTNFSPVLLKGLLFWTQTSGQCKKQLDAKRAKKEGIWDRRFVCKDCLKSFFGEFHKRES